MMGMILLLALSSSDRKDPNLSRNTHALSLPANGQLTPPRYGEPCNQKDADPRDHQGLHQKGAIRW
jgi:hypothetical protein